LKSNSRKFHSTEAKEINRDRLLTSICDIWLLSLITGHSPAKPLGRENFRNSRLWSRRTLGCVPRRGIGEGRTWTCLLNPIWLNQSQRAHGRFVDDTRGVQSVVLLVSG